MEPTNDLTAPGTTGAGYNPQTTPTTSRSAKKSGINSTATASTDSYQTSHAANTDEQPAAGVVGNTLNAGKKWLDDSQLLDRAGQLPQQVKDLGQQAWTRVSGLSNTQKAVGLGLLAAGVALLATRGGKGKKNSESEYRDRPRRSPFDKHDDQFGARKYDQSNQRGWGGSANSYRNNREESARVSSGSRYGSSNYGSSQRDEFGAGRRGDTGYGQGSHATGYTSGGSGQRRDQGPGRYDARTSGGQNPNNVDDLSDSL